jgi:hypothetical protein
MLWVLQVTKGSKKHSHENIYALIYPIWKLPHNWNHIVWTITIFLVFHSQWSINLFASVSCQSIEN